MSIFDGKHKTVAEEQLNLNPLEEEIAQKLAKSGILSELDRFLEEKTAQEDWLVTCQSYYDNRRRSVKIHEDLFAIGWNETLTQSLASGERVTVIDVDKSVGFHFTDFGYKPLHNHENERGNEDVTIDQVLFLWGIIVRDRMKAKLPQCKFSPVFQTLGETTFTYTVPEKEWKEWF